MRSRFLIAACILLGGVGCENPSAIVIVENYCQGANGMMLTDAQVSTCCTLDSELGVYTLDLSKVGTPDVPCPGADLRTGSGVVVLAGGGGNAVTNALDTVKAHFSGGTTVTDVDLAGSETQGADPSTLAQSGAATAGQIGGAAGLNRPATVPSQAKQGSPAAEGAGLSGGGSEGSSSSISTDTVSGSSDSGVQAGTQSLQAEAATAGVGAYSSGDGGSFRSGSASRGVHLKNSAPAELSMAGLQGDSTVLTIEDPSDYFTRLDLDQNLFKIMHRFYERKSRSWLIELVKQIDAKKASKSSPLK